MSNTKSLVRRRLIHFSRSVKIRRVVGRKKNTPNSCKFLGKSESTQIIDQNNLFLVIYIFFREKCVPTAEKKLNKNIN